MLFASERNREDVAKERQEFIKEQPKIDVKKSVFLDESGFNQNMTRMYGWSEKGSRVIGQVPSSQGKRVTILSAIGINGMISPLIFEGFLTTEIFLLYLEKFLLEDLSEGTTIFMDNCKCHLSEKVRELIESKKCILRYLPRYSPEFNPIELSWSQIKSHFKKLNPRTINEIEVAISKSIEMVTPQNAINYFRHSNYLVA